MKPKAPCAPKRRCGRPAAGAGTHDHGMMPGCRPIAGPTWHCRGQMPGLTVGGELLAPPPCQGPWPRQHGPAVATATGCRCYLEPRPPSGADGGGGSQGGGGPGAAAAAGAAAAVLPHCQAAAAATARSAAVQWVHRGIGAGAGYATSVRFRGSLRRESARDAYVATCGALRGARGPGPGQYYRGYGAVVPP